MARASPPRGHCSKNHVWSYDFVSTRTHGRPCAEASDRARRVHAGQCLAIKVGRKTRASTTFSRCSPISSAVGTVRPSICVSDPTEPEFTAKLVRRWLARLRGPDRSTSRRAVRGRTATTRSFNGKLRDEFLNGEIFYTTARGNGTRRAVEAAVQYRPTPSCPRRTTPRPRDDKTIALSSVRSAPTPGTTDGSESNIGDSPYRNWGHLIANW